MRYVTLCTLYFLACPVLMFPASGPPAARNRAEFRLVRECSRRVGPFATQTTAWQRWRQARSRGYRVSSGVFPCYDSSRTRGYCFNVFYPC